ncbi:MAG: protein kinase domain-containing protein [Vicinamibacterales bacterium]
MPLPLTDARWRKLEALFSAASELSASDRDAFVSRETAGDPDLARELRGMLDAGADAAAAIAGVVGSVAAGLANGWAGRRLGAYRIVRQIGRGGMGIVFEAVRSDDEYRKTVALKVPPPWSDPVLVGERFRLERQILAQLEHPNIARLLDGGTDDGTPYFVMEYVEGAPITDYCDNQTLDLRERLRLFLQICAAVGFAHQRLVVHRDLKPANILVADGTLKLLDFGIAKLLDPLAETVRTATMETRWTPDYTSPEQVQGHAVTTRTDVYSLGLILYELLTGERGQIADSTSPVALERSICEIQPARPSERVHRRDPGRARALRGDLDTIVMTALAKEPERRYPSVAALADDLNRFLDGRPILARPSTAGYRARKFLLRHRVGVAAATLVIVSLVGGLGAAVYEWRRADRRFQQVRALANTFVFDVHDQIESLPGATAARKTIVQTALVYLESLREDARNDPGLARDLAAAYEKVGAAQGVPQRANLGDSAGALVSLARAQELLMPLADRGDREARRRLVSVDTSIAMVKEANGDAAGAAASAARGQAIGEKLLQETPNDAELLAALAHNYATQAGTAANRHDLEDGERAARRSLALAERLVTIAPANLEYRDDAASAHIALGQALQAGPALGEAIDHFDASIRIREPLVAEAPNNLDFKWQLMVAYGSLGDVLAYQPGRNIGDEPRAAAAFQKAIAIAEWERGQDPADHRARYDVAAARLRLGTVEARTPSLIKDAIGQLRQAQQACDRLLSEDPRSDRFAVLCSAIDLNAGEALENAGRNREAQQQFEAARVAAEHISTTVLKRATMVNGAVHLAYLKAGQLDAPALATYAAGELTAHPVSTPFVDATLREDLGRAYAAIAEKSRRTDRPAWNAKAVAAFENCLQHWQALKLPPAVEPQRAEHIAVVEKRLSALKKPG